MGVSEPPKETPQESYDRATKAFSMGFLPDALSALQQCMRALRTSPNTTLLNQASILSRDIFCMMGKFQEAIELTTVMIANPNISQDDKTKHNHMLGQIHLQLKNFELARTFLRQPDVKAMFGKTLEYNFKCELIRVSLKDDVKDTLESYTEVLEHNPTSVDFLMKRFCLSYIWTIVQNPMLTSAAQIFEKNHSVLHDYHKLIQLGYPVEQVISSTRTLL